MESSRNEENRGLMADAEKSINIQHVAGVIEQAEIERLRRLIFRSTKGKSYMHVQKYNHDDDDDMSKSEKSVYIIVFWDGQHIREKIQRVCDSFQGQRYDLPEISEINTQINKLADSIKNARSVFERTRYELREQLIDFDSIDGGKNDFEDARRSSRIYIFKMFIAKEKALYQTLNMMKWQSTSFVGYFWAPHEQEEKIKSQLANQTATKIMAYKNHQIDPPTFFKTTEVSHVFQVITDTYGIPTYQEANPSPINIVTFPFMFGMMFGDMGHGSLYLFAGLYLTLFNDSLKKTSMGKIFSPYRYMVLLMGLCSTYCGFIYNEFFALPLNLFSSCYDLQKRTPWVPSEPDVPSSSY